MEDVTIFTVMVVLIILTIHFLGAKDNGHIHINNSLLTITVKRSMPILFSIFSLWVEAEHKEANWRVMIPLQASTVDRHSCISQ